MNLLSLLILLTITGICGAVAEFIVGYKPGGGGLVISIIVGVIGAFFGTWLATLFSADLASFGAVTVGNKSISLLWTLLGSLIVLFVLSLLRGRRLEFSDTQQ